MHTSISYRIVALTMAILMFSTSIGFSMDIHYCGDEMKSFSIFGDAEKCEMATKKKVEEEQSHACCHNKAKADKKMSCHLNTDGDDSNCCHNEEIVLELDSDFDLNQDAEVVIQQDFVFTTLYIFNSLFVYTIEEKTTPYFQYKPPLLIADVSILHQVFII